MICMEEAGMKRILFKVILPLLVIAAWMNMCYWICADESGINWFQFWIMSGFPFGIRKMIMLLIPCNFGIAEDTFGFVLSNKYILGLYKCCREARRDFALDRAKHEQEVSVKEQQFMEMKDVKVLAHCLLLDDVMLQDREIEAKLYTIFVN